MGHPVELTATSRGEEIQVMVEICQSSNGFGMPAE